MRLRAKWIFEVWVSAWQVNHFEIRQTWETTEIMSRHECLLYYLPTWLNDPVFFHAYISQNSNS